MNRTYLFNICDPYHSCNTIVLHRLFVSFTDDCEYIYAAQEQLDKILDLKIGQTCFFYPNRDNKDSKGIIHRIK